MKANLISIGIAYHMRDLCSLFDRENKNEILHITANDNATRYHKRVSI